VRPGAQEAAGMTGMVDLLIHHGATDAPSVGIAANGGSVLDSAAYQDFAGYLSVPATEFRIDVTAANDVETVIAPFYVDLAGFADAALTVFASGFLDPSANNSGEAFGLFAVGPNGGAAIPLVPVGNGRVQVIHNAADPAAETVDIYIDALADTIKLDDVDFRTAIPFTDLPSDYPLDIVVALPTSTDITDGAVADTSVTLTNGGSFYAVANGVLDTTDFSTAANGAAIAFQLYFEAAQEEAVDASMFDLKVFHGATDAPAVDITADDALPALIDSLPYGSFTDGYLALMPADYVIGVGANPVTAVGDLLARFDAPLANAAGGAGLVLASGFLTLDDEPEGAASFGLLFVQPDGTFTLLPAATSLQELPIDNSVVSLYPNPIQGQATLSYEVQEGGAVDVQLFDLQGREVLNNRVQRAPGQYEMNLDAQAVAPGVHLLMVTTPSTRSVLRVVVGE